MKKYLAERFLEEMKDQELWAPIQNSAPLIQTSGWTSFRYYDRYFETRLHFPVLVSVLHGEGTMYIPLTKSRMLAEEALEKYIRTPGYLRHIQEERERMELELRAFYHAMDRSYFEKTSVREAFYRITAFRDLVFSYNAMLGFALNFDREICERVVRRNGGVLSDEVWDRASMGPVLLLEKRHAWEVVEMFSQAGNFYESFQYHFADYAHVPRSVELEKLVRKEYAEYLDAKDPQEKVTQEEESFQEKLSSYREWVQTLSPYERSLTDFIYQVMVIRDERKDFLMMFATVLYRFARKRLRDAGIEENMAGYILYDELEKDTDYFRSQTDCFRKREANFAVYRTTHDDLHMAYGDTEKDRSILQDFLRNQHNGLGREDILRGQTGSKGNRTGKVRIVGNVRTEGKDFREGEILVAGMTRPEYLPLMKLAAAIITDEGGITCHAAIISRELGIPAVIGTKVATEVLKDGDLVEVDADKGTVALLDQCLDK